PYIAVQTKRYLYVEYRNGWRELYDLRRDPWEMNNVFRTASYRSVEATLHLLVRRLYDAPATTA
ncbi:MAG TPA: sulfatase/phosphatase domain-containing protein, partial [Gaiellaceae bacterium]|nr:sulfatase/phosphatase domain-containing protein [Gaiellaceae bacterium]